MERDLDPLRDKVVDLLLNKELSMYISLLRILLFTSLILISENIFAQEVKNVNGYPVTLLAEVSSDAANSSAIAEVKVSEISLLGDFGRDLGADTSHAFQYKKSESSDGLGKKLEPDIYYFIPAKFGPQFSYDSTRHIISYAISDSAAAYELDSLSQGLDLYVDHHWKARIYVTRGNEEQLYLKGGQLKAGDKIWFKVTSEL